jgi:hypothetical protein
MEDRAGPDTRTHPGVAATYRCAGASAGSAGDPAPLIDTNAYTDWADTCADAQAHAAAADADTQRHARENGHTNTHARPHGGASGQRRGSDTRQKKSDWEGGSWRWGHACSLDHGKTRAPLCLCAPDCLLLPAAGSSWNGSIPRLIKDLSTILRLRQILAYWRGRIARAYPPRFPRRSPAKTR